MEIKQQVTDLKLSKQLDILNVKQDSIWMWAKWELWKEPKLVLSDLATDTKLMCLSGKREYAYSAYAVAELGEMLKEKCVMPDFYKKDWFFLDKKGKKWLLETKTEANARAKMLIYLLENNLIKL